MYCAQCDMGGEIKVRKWGVQIEWLSSKAKQDANYNQPIFIAACKTTQMLRKALSLCANEDRSKEVT